jgi:hypothetical protein
LYILAKIAKVNTAEPPVPPAKSMPNLMSSDLSVMMPFCQVSSRWNLSYRHLWKVWNKDRAASVEAQRRMIVVWFWLSTN